MVELYTVMTSLVGDHSLGFFRESDFGSGKEPLQESHASFVHSLSQSTAAIGLTILKAAVKVPLFAAAQIDAVKTQVPLQVLEEIGFKPVL